MHEHLHCKEDAHVCFVDLQKAYDRLLKAFAHELHVPDNVVAALRRLYTGLSAQVVVDGNLLESFCMDEVCNKVAQPCLWYLVYTWIVWNSLLLTNCSKHPRRCKLGQGS